MATMTPTLRPLSCWKSLLRHSRQQKTISRPLTTYHHSKPASQTPLQTQAVRKIKTYPPPSSPAQIFKEPIKNIHAEQIAVLDPTGARTNLFSKTNPEAARVGDILLIRLKTGDPFAGVCINIRRRGVETGILLRNELTRVGVEMWYKIYSPNVEGIEVVQRKAKRARRARLTYMRKPKHDMGSVQNIVLQYQRTRGVLGRPDGERRQTSKKKTKGKK
ncbi:putative mitochondrial 54s ribosomal protein img1 protein [Botrytis fragariae]|uniref:Putative mitochondrial 54s ribosomal protein img1 protein n=1 Tax=Botrytis fragariae TaxID=1964551 RepID=A0A8H6ANB5_9HELO|nr:putative mitochondrial 54s ribosomal protein img1 protein [Botrytis fragariae]KAF5870923.1 putative mitochondrial 54s ribosomal protein img1 protein [Botrytis fragariae]